MYRKPPMKFKRRSFLASLLTATATISLGDARALTRLVETQIKPLRPDLPVGYIRFVLDDRESQELNVRVKNVIHAGNGEWLMCNGQTLDKAQYPQLFAVLGRMYTKSQPPLNLPVFALPDLRGWLHHGA
jgi:hypothetical protein